MNRRQKIIVSVTGIFLVLLILVGLTYAYFLTKINGNTNDKSISVTTANLEIKYEDNNDIIIGDKIEPGTTLPTKVFTVINNGNMNVEYSVGLVNLINTFSITEDVVYNVTCKSYNKEGFSLGTDGTVTGTENGTCSGVDETEFPTLNNYIVTNNIDVNMVHAYTMTVTYKETGTDQSIDMNKELSAKIDIFDPKSLTIQGNVTNSSDNDYVVIHSKEQESNIVDGNYRFIGITPDKHTITIKNRNTTDTKSASLDVSKGTPSVSNSKIVYNDEKNIADMDININDNTITLDVTKIENGKPTLGETILASAKAGGENRTTMGTTKTEFTSISGENERVLNNAPDDYGTSYYYYGAVTDNYVNFGNLTYQKELYIGYYSDDPSYGFEEYFSLADCQSSKWANVNCTQIHKSGDPILWRIVRINGDGSVKLVLDDIALNSMENLFKSEFNLYGHRDDLNDNTYVGYMHGTSKSSTYDDTHKNINDSTIKKAVDKWYEDNLKTNYANYISDTLFCNDKTLADSSIGSESPTFGIKNTALGYGSNATYYAAYQRLNNGTTSTPTFKCAENATNDYSRFTVNASTLPNGNKTNGNLTYPVGLLTADEVVYAGAYKFNQSNKSFYLYNSNISISWWLLSPYNYAGGPASSNLFLFNTDGILQEDYAEKIFAFRPSINLKASVLINGGDGTKENPYTLKLQ